jgi:hypothetical protein
LKAVFDTNIFVSALAIPGGQAERAVDLIGNYLATGFKRGESVCTTISAKM